MDIINGWIEAANKDKPNPGFPELTVEMFPFGSFSDVETESKPNLGGVMLDGLIDKLADRAPSEVKEVVSCGLDPPCILKAAGMSGGVVDDLGKIFDSLGSIPESIEGFMDVLECKEWDAYTVPVSNWMETVGFTDVSDSVDIDVPFCKQLNLDAITDTIEDLKSKMLPLVEVIEGTRRRKLMEVDGEMFHWFEAGEFYPLLGLEWEMGVNPFTKGSFSAKGFFFESVDVPSTVGRADNNPLEEASVLQLSFDVNLGLEIGIVSHGDIFTDGFQIAVQPSVELSLSGSAVWGTEEVFSKVARIAGEWWDFVKIGSIKSPYPDDSIWEKGLLFNCFTDDRPVRKWTEEANAELCDPLWNAHEKIMRQPTNNDCLPTVMKIRSMELKTKRGTTLKPNDLVCLRYWDKLLQVSARAIKKHRRLCDADPSCVDWNKSGFSFKKDVLPKIMDSLVLKTEFLTAPLFGLAKKGAEKINANKTAYEVDTEALRVPGLKVLAGIMVGAHSRGHNLGLNGFWDLLNLSPMVADFDMGSFNIGKMIYNIATSGLKEEWTAIQDDLEGGVGLAFKVGYNMPIPGIIKLVASPETPTTPAPVPTPEDSPPTTPAPEDADSVEIGAPGE